MARKYRQKKKESFRPATQDRHAIPSLTEPKHQYFSTVNAVCVFILPINMNPVI